MSYRITLNGIPVECDTAEEVLVLTSKVCPGCTPGDIQVTVSAPTARIGRAGEQWSRDDQAAILIAYLEKKGKAARVAELAEACSIDEEFVREALDGPEFEPMARGFYRLTGSAEQLLPAEPKPRKRSVIFDEDPEPAKPSAPRPTPVPEPAAEPASLVDKLVKAFRQHGPMAIGTLSIAVDVRMHAVKEALRSREDLFVCDPAAGGWRLKAS